MGVITFDVEATFYGIQFHNIALFYWDIGKQCKTRSDAAASDQVLHCLLTEDSFKIRIKIKKKYQIDSSN